MPDGGERSTYWRSRIRRPGHEQAPANWPCESGLPAVAVVVAFTISLVAALSSSAAPARPSARPTLPLHPQPAPTRVVSTQLYSPFTGEPVRALKRVLAVKIDNIVTARPQTGLQSADIVYVEPVEGGLTRFMAVFSSRVPTTVGPVRSARESDLYLLPQFGRPAFAWSGATRTWCRSSSGRISPTCTRSR